MAILLLCIRMMNPPSFVFVVEMDAPIKPYEMISNSRPTFAKASKA
jgi:hypothetical protein